MKKKPSRKDDCRNSLLRVSSQTNIQEAGTVAPIIGSIRTSLLFAFILFHPVTDRSFPSTSPIAAP